VFAKEQANSGCSDYDEKAIFFTQIPNAINNLVLKILHCLKKNKKKENRCVLV
jgi:hypothetical protein